MSKNISEIEKEIDHTFENNPLNEVDYSQAVWTLMEALENMYFKVRIIDKQTPAQIAMWTDVMLNAATHPLRVLYAKKSISKSIIEKRFNENHFRWAYQWLNDARAYNEFCTIFPLYHNGNLKLTVEGESLIVHRGQDELYRYEAYNRVMTKDGNSQDHTINTSEIIYLLMPYVTLYEDNINFNIELNSKIIKELVDICKKQAIDRYKLPKEWQATEFSFDDFINVFETIKAILVGRLIIRDFLAVNNLPVLGNTSIIWTISNKVLIMLLTECTNVSVIRIKSILEFLTFGNKGIKSPDIAIQPIISLCNGEIAMSPFVWMNSDAERNLCVLLNKIDNERDRYLELANKKESIFRQEIRQFINDNILEYDIKYGELGCTDLDIAIIDRIKKVCICLELKWFLEPAEVQEIKNKSQELVKGVKQAKIISTLYKEKDNKLLDILDITSDYEFFAIVGCRNWIGDFDVQDVEVPIIKIGHLLEKINEVKNLKEIIYWLKNRLYLPIKGIDFEICTLPIKLSNWKCDWYGIKIL